MTNFKPLRNIGMEEFAIIIWCGSVESFEEWLEIEGIELSNTSSDIVRFCRIVNGNNTCVDFEVWN